MQALTMSHTHTYQVHKAKSLYNLAIRITRVLFSSTTTKRQNNILI